MQTPRRLERTLLERLARQVGLAVVGCTTADAFPQARQTALERLQQGLMGTLPWYHTARVLRGTDPQVLLPGARSLIAVAVSYWWPQEPAPRPLTGRVARYAWGLDYHKALKERLRTLMHLLEAQVGPFRWKVYVDDGPLLEREVARRAGVGWFGKNTNILTPIGSWVFLGEALTDLEVTPDPPLKKTCGQCQACMPACPTGALIAPYVLDSRRCIAYLTIEHRGPIPRHLRPLIGDWVFGCDICQEVCPVNRKAQPTTLPELEPRAPHQRVDLLEVLSLTEEGFQERFRGTSIRRATRVGLQRNACVVLGNLGDPAAVPALTRALREGEPLVRGHAAWALGRIGTFEALSALHSALSTEPDPWVGEEIRMALHDATLPLSV
ncbi:MAG: tRNA epoxyqueuosine(34) reductase QueG [Dehalococcoidia bacterium]|nr:tRNA epoxyqueuosine(34) reductase QueG [Dehalococcoidia bacterium]MDW8119588.1 tRNA epoxyqueuosine(34) reductase QueG [Chloroflexota bacterium]